MRWNRGLFCLFFDTYPLRAAAVPALKMLAFLPCGTEISTHCEQINRAGLMPASFIAKHETGRKRML